MRLRLAALVSAALLPVLAPPAAAQDARFAPHRLLFQARAREFPALFEAIRNGRAGKLAADPDVQKAITTGLDAYAKDIAPWFEQVDFLQRLAPRAADPGTRFERLLHRIDWRLVRDAELAASLPPKADGQESVQEFVNPFLTCSLRATDGGRERVDALFDAFAKEVCDATPLGLKLAEKQEVLGQAGVVAIPSEEQVDHGPFYYGNQQPFWMQRRGVVLNGGSGAAAAVGEFAAMAVETPHVAVGMSITDYARMMLVMLAGRSDIEPVFEAIGIDNATWFEWRLGTNGDLLQDDLVARFDGKPHGIAGALLQSTAPLPPQPLPEGALLQLRCGFDVEPLLRAVDRLLEHAELQTLAEMQVREDIERAWTGGMALAITRPTGLVPRIYASFGIADEAALGRLLDRLVAAPFVKATPRAIGDRAATQIAIESLPPALQPCYSLVSGTLHVAESLPSLKAQLAAIDGGARPAMDVGKGTRPTGPGTTLPSLELRYDAAAIHMALQQVWVPLAELQMLRGETKAYVPLKQMPEADLVAEHLVPGRGVLRRDGTTYMLSCSGTLGSPFLQGLVAILGPMLTFELAGEREYQLRQTQSEISWQQLQIVHKALAAFEQKEQRKAASLGELLGKGLVRDIDLLMPGDDAAEPVMHDGKEVGKTSYRYYEKPIKVSPDGEEIEAELIAIKKVGWWRYALDKSGNPHAGYGEFSEGTIADIEKKAKGQ